MKKLTLVGTGVAGVVVGVGVLWKIGIFDKAFAQSSRSEIFESPDVAEGARVQADGAVVGHSIVAGDQTIEGPSVTELTEGVSVAIEEQEDKRRESELVTSLARAGIALSDRRLGDAAEEASRMVAAFPGDPRVVRQVQEINDARDSWRTEWISEIDRLLDVKDYRGALRQAKAGRRVDGNHVLVASLIDEVEEKYAEIYDQVDRLVDTAEEKIAGGSLASAKETFETVFTLVPLEQSYRDRWEEVRVRELAEARARALEDVDEIGTIGDIFFGNAVARILVLEPGDPQATAWQEARSRIRSADKVKDKASRKLAELSTYLGFNPPQEIRDYASDLIEETEDLILEVERLTRGGHVARQNADRLISHFSKPLQAFPELANARDRLRADTD